MTERVYVTANGLVSYPVLGKTPEGREVIESRYTKYAILGFPDMNRVDYSLDGLGNVNWSEIATERPLSIDVKGEGGLEAMLEKEPRVGLRILGVIIDANGKIIPSREHGSGQLITTEIFEIKEV